MQTDVINAFEKNKGQWSTKGLLPLANMDDLSVAYTPGVAEISKRLAAHPEEARLLSMKGRTVAVVTDGSSVLGLGNIGPLGGLPVMEGKSVLYKAFGGVDAVPICLATQDPQEIIETVIRIAPSFGGIHLEDIAAPACFQIETELAKRLDIPVFHDDQHGTAVVVLAALMNALKVVGKELSNVKIVFSGAGAAGIASAKLLIAAGAKQLVIVDSKGVVGDKRVDIRGGKQEIVQHASRWIEEGSLQDALHGADVFIGVSRGGLLNAEDVKTMNKNAIVFAMANPIPEIMPDEARAGGAAVVASGRSDFPNQVNNVLAYPGIMLGALRSGLRTFETRHFLAAAAALAQLVKDPNADRILPTVFDPGVAEAVASAVGAGL